jgi:hypothetical protein
LVDRCPIEDFVASARRTRRPSSERDNPHWKAYPRRPAANAPTCANALTHWHCCQDAFGHFTKTLDGRTQPIWVRFRAAELADETGIPVLYISGSNFNWRAHHSIMFADQRRLRFLVRGTQSANAIMTAVDQAGNRVARYRIIDKRSTEIIVNPGWKLTDELTLAIAISASQLDTYFERPDRF